MSRFDNPFKAGDKVLLMDPKSALSTSPRASIPFYYITSYNDKIDHLKCEIESTQSWRGMCYLKIDGHRIHEDLKGDVFRISTELSNLIYDKVYYRKEKIKNSYE